MWIHHFWRHHQMFDVCACDDDETLNDQTTMFQNLSNSYSGDLGCRVINFNLSEFFILYQF